MITGLVDVDCKPGFPNLALMKLSTWLKGRGHSVRLSTHRISARHHRLRLSFPLEFTEGGVDSAFVSVVFTWHRDEAAALGRSLRCPVEYGGPGWRPGWQCLLGPIERSLPDYDLYGTDVALGFINRGCFRKCEFCNVPWLEGPIVEQRYMPPWEWVPDGFRKCLLLDNEFAHYDAWRQRVLIEWFRSAGVRYCLTQGYDLRILAGDHGEELAAILAGNKPHADDFKRRHLFTAWDYFGNEPAIRKGLERLLAAGFRREEVSVYTIAGGPVGTGFHTTHEQDLHRVRVLWGEFGVFPFVMKYDNRRDDPWLNRFTRAVNLKPILRRTDWGSYPTT